MSGSLGKRLISARRSLGVSLKDAEGATRIRVKYLEALENSDYDTLPSYPYARGHLIAYCKYLNLDTSELLRLLELEMGPDQDRDRLEGLVSGREIREPKPAIPARTVLSIVAATVAIAIIAIWAQGAARGPEPLPPVPTVPGAIEETLPPASVESTPPAASTPGPIVPSDSIAPPSAEPFLLRVVIDPGSSSWLKITIDGLTAYEGVLTADDAREWEVSSQATLRIGRPGSVTILRDGSPIEIPAGAETPEITITAEDTTQR